MNKLLTIVPVAAMPGKPTATMGTKVLGPDGSPIKGITRIELVADVNNVWRARIDCMATVPTIESVSARIVEAGIQLTWWRRVLLRLAGVREAECTNLGSEAREFQRINRGAKQ